MVKNGEDGVNVNELLLNQTKGATMIPDAPTADQYGEGFSIARGLARTPAWIWFSIAGLASAGYLCLKMSGHIAW